MSQAMTQPEAIEAAVGVALRATESACGLAHQLDSATELDAASIRRVAECLRSMAACVERLATIIEKTALPRARGHR